MTRTPRETADLQLQYYNARDLDGFCSLFAEDAVLSDLPSGAIVADGIEAIRAMYRDRFNNPDLFCRVHAKTDLTDFAIDRETITGVPGGPVDIIAMYEVKNGLITRVMFIRDKV